MIHGGGRLDGRPFGGERVDSRSVASPVAGISGEVIPS